MRQVGRPSDLRDNIHTEAVRRGCSDKEALAALLNEYGREETARRLECTLFALDKAKGRMGVGAVHHFVVLPETGS